MFISSKDNESRGLKYEFMVFNQLKETFEQEESFCIHGYPMYYSNGQSHREIDILFVHKILGLFNIEVKGILTDQILGIQGHNWNVKDYYAETIAPFHQALNQTYMLKDHMNKHLMLGKKINLITLVALPQITEIEWIEKGFAERLDIPLPLFKDDLISQDTLKNKLLSYTTGIKKRPLLDDDWTRVLNYFQIPSKDHPNEKLNVQIHYELQLFSKLYIVEQYSEFQRYEEEIKGYLQKGIKIYLLTYDSEIQDYCKKLFKQYTEELQLSIYESKEIENRLKTRVVDNGQIMRQDLEKISIHFSNFNKGQYIAIHCEPNEKEIITAGAGTGKTHVMIDRILYLLIAHRVDLKTMIMITFTNASTNEMRNRLENKFISLFDLTGHSRFLKYAEEVKTMQISTIHSFAKSVIKQLAHELGYGQNINLRSFIYEKKLIIQELIEEYFQTANIKFFKKHQLRHYEVVNFITDMWEEMEKKGLSRDEIINLEWGEIEVQSVEVAKLLQYVFKYCEDRIEKQKKKQNAITMGDLIRKLKNFTAKPQILNQLNEGCFMFVDEFQDSDDVQIEFIAKLHTILKYNLFVVGDVKQSVYRFRGADYRSFDELKSRIGNDVSVKEITLQHNYRSSRTLLDKMNLLFKSWGEQEPQLLSYKSDDRLFCSTESHYKQNWIVKTYDKESLWEETVKEQIQKAVLQRKDETCKIALLVRTNWQAKEMKRICSELEIATTENLDGTFYCSETVIHFKALIEALLYPNEPIFVLNALETPYFRYQFHYLQLIVFKGDRETLNNYLHSVSERILSPYVELLREHSAMTVVQKIIYDMRVLENIQNFYVMKGMEKEVAQMDSGKYIANLQQLMNLIESNFDQQKLSLYTVVQWLKLQMNTNRTENEPMLEGVSAPITISTVHRAKGLEFDTVILPIINKPYNSVQSKFYIEDNENKKSSRKVGWQLKDHQNYIFNELNVVEEIEQCKEEVRLLYVALTRAEQKIIVLMPKIARPDTWAHLLEQANIGGIS